MANLIYSTNSWINSYISYVVYLQQNKKVATKPYVSLQPNYLCVFIHLRLLALRPYISISLPLFIIIHLFQLLCYMYYYLPKCSVLQLHRNRNKLTSHYLFSFDDNKYINPILPHPIPNTISFMAS